MKKRFLAFLCCLSLILSVLPTQMRVKANTDQRKYLNRPEDAIKVLNQKNNTAKLKGKSAIKSSQNEIRKRVIVKMKDSVKNTYEANDSYYYRIGGYQILFYDSVKKAENAVEKLRADYPEVDIFQDIPVSLKNSAKDNGSSKEDTSFDGIHMMGMDALKENTKDWNGASVAVIDSGIDEDHPWFENRLDRKNSINFAVDQDSDDYDDRSQGHGTHVAGIITQATPEQVKIMAVRVFDLTGSASYTTITLAVDYAVEHKADVINMSLGFEIAPGFESRETNLMDEAFARALAAKTTVCAASGNEYTDTSRSYPASSLWTIAVGSLEPSGKTYIRSDFSNNGELLDFAAPGRNIFSAWIGEGESTAIASGTSMATPHMAAAAAYIKMKHPAYNQRDVYAAFRDRAVDLGAPGKDTEFGYGYVDLSDYDQKDTDQEKEYQAITAPAQINKTMNEAGKEIALDAMLTRGDGTLSYESSNEKVAKISGDKIIITGTGKCDILITASETDKYKETTQKVKIEVEKGQQVIKIPVSTYKKLTTDAPFQLEAYVESPGDGKIEFIANENDVLKVTRNGEVTILGEGTAQVYAIAKATDSFRREVSDAITVIVEKDTKATTATNKTDITKPSNEKDQASTATTETKAKAKISVKQMKLKKVKAGKKKASIFWTKQKGATGYQIRYATSKKMKKAKVLKTGKNSTSKVIKKLKTKKRYYFQIRAYAKDGNKTIYGKWSKNKTVKVK